MQTSPRSKEKDNNTTTQDIIQLTTIKIQVRIFLLSNICKMFRREILMLNMQEEQTI